MNRKKNQSYFDNSLVFIVVFLLLFGLLMLYSASLHKAALFKAQFLYAILGLVVMWIVSKIDYHRYKRWAGVLFIVALVLVFLVRFPGIGVARNGATRWIKLGPITIQPAEVFKITVIIFNASVIHRLGKKVNRLKTVWKFIGAAAVEAAILLLVTDNLSSGLIVAGITVIMIFVAYPKHLVFVGLGILGASGVAAIVYMAEKLGAVNFRFIRILSWLHPEQYDSFQTMQGLYAIGSGGIWGKGLGASAQKMILPEAQNDMIFAIVCEELGLVGAFIVITMYLILLYRLIFIAKNARDLFGGMLVTGIFAHFSLQIVLNIAVVTNSIPPTGITLPFISYGGTALLFLMIEIGIALNVSKQIRFRKG